MIDPPLPVLLFDELYSLRLRQGRAAYPERQVRPDENGHEAGPVGKDLLGAPPQYHKGLPGLGVLPQQPEL